MKNTLAVALAVALGLGSTAALADGSPELNRPFARDFYGSWAARHQAPAPTPVASDAEALARLQSNGYRSIAGLTRGSDGVWHATASRGSARVRVAVLADGRVLVQ